MPAKYPILHPAYADRHPTVRPMAVVVEQIISEMRGLGSPFVGPKQLAPHLAITVGAVRYHCRNCRATARWRGYYRFYWDDPEHVAALRALIAFALWSVMSPPAAYRPRVH